MKKPGRQKGIAMLMLLFVSIVLLILSEIILTSNKMNMDLMARAKLRSLALQTAEAGLSYAFYHINYCDDNHDGRPDRTWNSVSQRFDTAGHALQAVTVVDSLPGRDADGYIHLSYLTNCKFRVRCVNNLDKSENANNNNVDKRRNIRYSITAPSSGVSETVPDDSILIVSEGVVGDSFFSVNRTVVSVSKVADVSAYSIAARGAIRSQNGDLLVNGISSTTDWISTDGNMYSGGGSPQIAWNGQGTYMPMITGKVTSEGAVNTISFTNPNPAYTQAPYSLNPTTRITMQPGQAVEMPAGADVKNGICPSDFNTNNTYDSSMNNVTPQPTITLSDGTYYFIDDNYNSSSPAETPSELRLGKVVLNNARLLVKNTKLVVSDGIVGNGAVAVTGNTYDHTETRDEWRDDGEVTNTIGERCNGWDDPPDPPPTDDGSMNSVPFLSDLMNGVRHGASRLLSWFDFERMGNAFSGTVYADDRSDLPPIDLGRREKERTDWWDNRPCEHHEHGEDGTHKEKIKYERGTRYRTVFWKSAGSTFNGTLDMDTNQTRGVAFYSDGDVTINGNASSPPPSGSPSFFRVATDLKQYVSGYGNRRIGQIVDEMVPDSEASDSAPWPSSSSPWVLGGYTMTWGDARNVKRFMDANPGFANQPAREFGRSTSRDPFSPLLITLAQRFRQYQYFQGVVFTQGRLNVNDRVAVVGGVIANGSSSSGVTFNNGAILTCNADYLSIFREVYIFRYYRATAWHELGSSVPMPVETPTPTPTVTP